jgi:hypothetical protein
MQNYWCSRDINTLGGLIRGKTDCPLARDAQILVTSTPRFAKQVCAKIAHGSVREVQQDLRDNHGRGVAMPSILGLPMVQNHNWHFLNLHTDEQILNFYHASGHLGGVAAVRYPDHPIVQHWRSTHLSQRDHPIHPKIQSFVENQSYLGTYPSAIAIAAFFSSGVQL